LGKASDEGAANALLKEKSRNAFVVSSDESVVVV
jgi:hypothetical protein